MKARRIPSFCALGVCLATRLLLVAGHSVAAGELDPLLVGQFPPYGAGHVQAIAISGDHAYVAFSGAGLQILDIRNPSAPLLAGVYDPPACVVDVAVQGRYAYIRVDRHSDFQIIEVSDPTRPRFVGTYSSVPEGFESLLDLGDLAVSGERACWLLGARGDGGLAKYRIEVIDVSNPANPKGLSGFDISRGGGLAMWGNQLFVASRWYDGTNWSAVMQVFDIADPAHPRQLKNRDSP